ncbi:hypothetical protein BU26DRAFT_333697 [Trematosphaeria pertusa]|uniref:Uncharacterized protein n=1 Tax=Trematosphaeria pertusa TaxID=390896 RepID=A0A6A6IEC9_9PLEO|nr:uncharacterized protein BU26DRAFT_333697 [Trematosphaeria pertusa]KAF2248418.1 hypothetical protein BU26DRAFT_333697 [Trematosphaeria pertusa]
MVCRVLRLPVILRQNRLNPMAIPDFVQDEYTPIVLAQAFTWRLQQAQRGNRCSDNPSLTRTCLLNIHRMHVEPHSQLLTHWFLSPWSPGRAQSNCCLTNLLDGCPDYGDYAHLWSNRALQTHWGRRCRLDFYKVSALPSSSSPGKHAPQNHFPGRGLPFPARPVPTAFLLARWKILLRHLGPQVPILLFQAWETTLARPSPHGEPGSESTPTPRWRSQPPRSRQHWASARTNPAVSLNPLPRH